MYLKTLYGTDAEARVHVNCGGTTETGAGRVGGLIEVHHHQSDGFKTIRHASGNDDDTGFEKTDYMLKFSWEPPTERHQFAELKVGYTDFEANETYLGLSEADFSNDPYQRYYASHFDNFRGYQLRSYLRHIMEVTDAVTIDTVGYYNRFHRNWYKLNDLRGVDGEVLASGSVSMSEALARGGNYLATLKGENGGVWRVRANNRDYDLWGIQSTAEAQFEALEASHTAELGLRYHTDTADRFQWQDDHTVDDSGNVLAVSYGTKGAAGDREQEARAFAMFLQDELTWDRLSITPGIRYEHLDYEYLDRNSGDGKQTGNGEVHAFGANARYNLSDDWMLFSGVYRGYSVPSPYDYLNSSKKLEEETSMGYELGTRYRRDGLTLQVAGFYTEFDDLIVGGYVGGPADTDAENAGNVDALGLELKAEYDAAASLDSGIRCPLWLAYTYTDATLDGDSQSSDPGSIFSGGEDGNQVPYIPENQFSIGAGLEGSRWSVELVASYVAATFTTASNTNTQLNPVTGTPDARFGKTDSRWVVDLSGHYRMWEHARLFLNVYNLLDDEYLASRHPHGPRPGRPFAAMGGIELTF